MRLALLLTTFLFSFPLLAADDLPIATILCYHEVDDAPSHETIPRLTATGSAESERVRYTASVANFVAQLDYLQKNDYNVIPLAELVDYLEGKRDSIPPRAVVITVDDGWSCAYDEIYPELAKRKLPWTLFLYPKIIGHGSHAVTWDEVATLARHGVDIESHSYSHPFLTGLGAEMLSHEIADSRTILQEKTNEPVRFFCYPYGAFDNAVIAAIRGAGYEAALTTTRAPIRRSTDPMKLTRYLIHADTSLDEFASFLIGSSGRAAGVSDAMRGGGK